ncbi:FAD-dependent oxidoreductase [Paenibacillus sp. 1011MAR3C5]|uniref:FAD-dependent oxidoreductase n=1 Tax=Paenibacillus sp. 1011MAR3C5 TaxID=1675787 RepID=UPI000E6BB5F9|nr:FAD-dependent oxidoreductase [Paenibacillus sp. 1011MAR3C5]RJE83972.1 FAD-dependent oxidoreductase [Paenibacillus sp. 1011MAR3C5]
MRNRHADVVIIGGSTGGCAAALAAARAGRTVIMTEESDWIGGQLTSQAVPPDEHPWMEQFGCTASYREFRTRIREYYRRNFLLNPASHASVRFNPGNAIVSDIAHEPRAALAVLKDMLAPYIHRGSLAIMENVRPVRAETEGDRVRAVYVRHEWTGDETVLTAACFLDATDEGDLLPMTGTEYVTGAESARETGEPHALAGDADPSDMQAFTWCYAIDHIEGEDHTIAKPAQYDFWKQYRADFWPDRQLSWTGLVPHTLAPITYSFFPDGKSFSLWHYRRIIDRSQFAEGSFESDITLVNWPQNDYWLGPIIDVEEAERQKHLESARQLSLSLMYWMQTEAPRPDGKAGYPGLRLRGDVTGTLDGLAKRPYIRESRRIKAETTVVEQHVSPECRPDGKAMDYPDSVGIGGYRIDLHPSTGLRSYIDVSCLPFQIPLGSLIPERMDNMIAACKNIGTTHITNGCYRLHPVEWNIGEAAGFLAAYCAERGLQPRAVRNNEEALAGYQAWLRRAGVETKWPQLRAL